MNKKIATPEGPEDFSLVLGGPLYQMYLRSGLVRPPADLVQRRIIAFIVLTWLPLVVLSFAGGTAFGGVEVPFLLDLDVHIRFLLALPLLIGAEVLVHQRIRVTIGQFIERGIIAPEDRPRFNELIASAMRLRNSAGIEIALIVCSVTLGYFVWREQMTLRVGTWYVSGESLTVAGWWYAFISLNLFRFVLFRWYFRLIVWYVFLWRVSRLPLQVNPLHPDRGGGLGFIGNSVFAFTPVLLAHTVVLSGVIGGRILHEGMKLPAFQIEIVAAVALLMVVMLLPLAFLYRGSPGPSVRRCASMACWRRNTSTNSARSGCGTGGRRASRWSAAPTSSPWPIWPARTTCCGKCGCSPSEGKRSSPLPS